MTPEWCFTRAPFKVVENNNDRTLMERFWLVDASGYVHAKYFTQEIADANARAWNVQAVKYRMFKESA